MFQHSDQWFPTKSTVTEVDSEQDLVLAARQGNVQQVKQLLNCGVSVNAVDEFGMTSLMLFAAQGLSDGVRLLLDHPACLVNKRTSSMVVALHFAAEKGHVDCVELLLRHGAVVNVSDDWGETPLIKAAGGGSSGEPGYIAVLSLLLNNGARTDMIDLHGRDALVHAARSGSTQGVRVLLEHGANPNHGSRALALHEAAAFGHVGCVEALLEAGARPNLRNLHGHLPLELATHMDHSAVVECLLHRTGWTTETRDSALAMAVASNAVSCLMVLLRHGANPDVMDSTGVPALHLAVETNNADAVRLLLRYNATVNRRLYHTFTVHNAEVRSVCTLLGLDYVTPLMLATIRGRGSLIRMLIDAGAAVGVILRMLRDLNVLRQLTALTANTELVAWLSERCAMPSSLQQLSVLAVRARFPSECIDTIYKLPLPRPLLDFVAFADLTVE
jgi:ankyrin repeat protein